MKLDKTTIEFLKQSNAIENEFSDEALKDAELAWTMACLNITELDKNYGIKYICKIHKKLLKNLNKKIAGKFRTCPVYVGTKTSYVECLKYDKIEEELLNLLKTEPKTEDEIKLWHIKFEKIHPFEDGNGRVGRILLNIQRVLIQKPLLIIHTGVEQFEYYKWFKEDENEK